MDCVIRWQTFVNRENQMLAEARIAADMRPDAFLSSLATSVRF
jgi:hypothetical protein